MKNTDRKKFKFLYLLLLAAILAAIFFGYQYFSLKNSIDSKEVTQSSDILQNLSKIFMLPNESNPTVATISNIDDLKIENEEFYKNAVNGDTLVLYSKLAILYREQENIVVNAAQLDD